MQNFSIPIDRVIDLLGLVRDPKGRPDTASTNVQCPFCDDAKYHLNCNRTNNIYRCVRCGEGGGALDLYWRIAHGQRVIKGQNTKEAYAELVEALNLSPAQAKRNRQAPVAKEIQRASDAAVHAAYKAILDMPEFMLNAEHKEDLEERGMSEEAIVRNEYRSFSLGAAKALNTTKAVEVFKGLKATIKQHSPREHLNDTFLIAGLEIANRLLTQGIKMRGVPGFFQAGRRWCFLFEEGMAIPTRNMEGEIVCLQVRKASGSVRYMTISSKGFPEGVNMNISRTHFPLANKNTKNTKWILTEGPLKADVALDLMGDRDVAFIAIHGVNNTNELPDIFAVLRNNGVDKIYNGLDMDRLTNPNVAKASRAIRALAFASGLQMYQRYWDQERAEKLCRIYEPMCSEKGLKYTRAATPFVTLARVTKALADAEISIPKDWNDEETPESEKTKGIDDWMLYTKRIADKKVRQSP